MSKPGSTQAAQTIRLLIFVILLKPVGNLIFAYGLKALPQTLSFQPLAYLQAIISPVIATGIALQILWLLSRMALLSRADLSFVLPATASGYAISALLGKFFLAEQVTAKQWIGIALICCGGSFVGMTKRKTAPVPEQVAEPAGVAAEGPQPLDV